MAEKTIQTSVAKENLHSNIEDSSKLNTETIKTTVCNSNSRKYKNNQRNSSLRNLKGNGSQSKTFKKNFFTTTSLMSSTRFPFNSVKYGKDSPGPANYAIVGVLENKRKRNDKTVSPGPGTYNIKDAYNITYFKSNGDSSIFASKQNHSRNASFNTPIKNSNTESAIQPRTHDNWTLKMIGVSFPSSQRDFKFENPTEHYPGPGAYDSLKTK